MAEFRIKIAGHVAQITSLFESTRDYCRCYLTEEPPEFFLETCREDLETEQRLAREEAQLEGFRFRNFPDPYLERASIQRKIALQLFRHNVVVLHGSVVAVDGEGYLFTAKSGTGKSTHTRLWRQVFGSRAVMVNDDKPFLTVAEEGITVCGAPWSGKHGLDTNITVPLKAICILQRGTENRICRIDAAQALPMLLHQSCPPLEEALQAPFRQRIEDIARRTPLWQMQCTRDSQAAETAYCAMASGGQLPSP